MARLLVAQQVSGTAQVEIVARQREAGTQRVERLQHLQPLVGGGGERAIGGCREQRIGALLRAAHASPQLIELRQSEHVRPMDDQRVCSGNVEARLHDRRRQQHVELPVIEAGHDVFQLGRRHPAMGGAELHLRHVFAQEARDLVKIRDARHHIETLAATEVLAQQALADDDVIEG